MDLQKLEAHIIETIQEAHLKLGFDSAPMTLNYTLSTLNNIFGSSLSADEMSGIMREFCESLSGRIGSIEVSAVGDVFCFTASPQLREYVRDNTDISPFLAEFITAVRDRKPIEEILDVFRRYSDCVHIEQVDNEEFDYLAYFDSGIPDDHYYCLTVEGPMVSYHRFTRDDYMAFGF